MMRAHWNRKRMREQYADGHHRGRVLRLALASTILFSLLEGEVGAQTVPGAGLILQQAQSVNSAARPAGMSGLAIEPENRVGMPASPPFMVNSILLTGHSLFDTATLHTLVADGEGKNLTLTQLSEAAARITTFYHDHGYPLARAIIPAQNIQSGTIQIQVIEARYAKIKIDNHSRVAGLLFERTLSSLHSGQPIERTKLERAVLLASDIPGVIVSSTLKPGTSAGTSDLDVEIAAKEGVTGSVTLDDEGNRYTGRLRLGSTLNVFNPLQHGDVLSVSATTSGPDLNYLSLSYESLVSGAGTRAGGSISGLRYVLGDTLASIDGHGKAEVGSLWLRQPLVRSVDFNIYGQAQFDHKQLNDEIDVGAIQTNRHIDSLTISLAGDSRDTLLSGAINIWNVAWVAGGRLGFDNAAAQLADSMTARTQGKFSMLTANASRLQQLDSQNAIYFKLSGQLASHNLDPSEKMLAGGAYSVRAYDIGAATGDTGILGTFEYRRAFGQTWGGQAQATIFLDSERVTVNKTSWAPGDNLVTLSGLGVSCDWSGLDQWTAKASIATPIGPTQALISNNKSLRVWVELDKGF
ncbi:MAG TPA: ShlB/FhaC/HecB family hemolysin secretion/activation protein [Burkholderiaceae bacterium]